MRARGRRRGAGRGRWDVRRECRAIAPERAGAPGLTYPATAPTKRIDFVTASPNTTVLGAQTQDDPTHILASDHRAVVATVLLNQGSESSR